MLQLLRIQDFILIDLLEVSFASGFTSITGETGAGKSIFVGALSMLQGRRADSSLVKAGAKRSVIEATFVALPPHVEEWLRQKDLWMEDGACVVWREISAMGRSRCFINDTPVPLATLAELGVLLIDIHSQHQNLQLSSNQFQLHIVDRMSDDPQLLPTYKTSYTQYEEATRALEELKSQIARSREEYDYNLFRYQELSDAQLVEGEEEGLLEEETLLRHADEIKSTLYQVQEMLDGESSNVIGQLSGAIRQLEEITSKFPRVESHLERLNSCAIEMRDVARDLASFTEQVDTDPEALAHVSARLDLINTLCQKYHHPDTKGLIALREELHKKVQFCDGQEDLLLEAEKKSAAALKEVQHLGEKLSKTRQSTALKLGKKLSEELRLLEMPHARVEFRVTPLDAPSPTGYDRVEVLFSANGDAELQPVGSVASGGEMARLMLTIKAMLAACDHLPTILFDEIDTGVSGRVADRMGQVLRTMGHHLQVIAITHLPQIAARSEAQMAISKHYNEETERASTELRTLSPQERKEEVARLISGSVITPVAMAAAQELLQNND